MYQKKKKKTKKRELTTVENQNILNLQLSKDIFLFCLLQGRHEK